MIMGYGSDSTQSQYIRNLQSEPSHLDLEVVTYPQDRTT